MAIAQSLYEQAEHALLKITKFGESKHLMKQTKGREEVEKWIFSTGSLSKHKSNLKQILNFVEKEFGIKRVIDIRTKHTRAFIEQKQKEGYAPKTLKSYVSSLKKLEHAAVRAWNCCKPRFVNRNLELGKYEPGTTEVTKAFSSEEVSKMLDISYSKDFKRGLGIETMARCGLRSGELASVKANSVKLDGLSQKDLKELRTKCPNEKDYEIYKRVGEGPCIYLRGKHSGAKNGRYRVVPIPKDMAEKFKRLLASRKPSERFFGVKERMIRLWVQYAKEETNAQGKGCHGLRKTFCRQYVGTKGVEYVESKMTKAEEFQNSIRELSALLGHSRAEIMKYYL